MASTAVLNLRHSFVTWDNLCNPSLVKEYTFLRFPEGGTSHSDDRRPSRSRVCSKGYIVPSVNSTSAPERSLIAWIMPYPCCGPSDRIRRTRGKAVPFARSFALTGRVRQRNQTKKSLPAGLRLVNHTRVRSSGPMLC